MVRRNAWDERGDAVPGFRPTDEQLMGKTEEDQDELRAAVNERDLQRILSDHIERDERAKTISSQGGWVGFGFS